jgi:L-ascorbate 6-phosphate lactonase
MRTGKNLIADIDACRTGKGRCALWWLGQLSFIAKFGKTVIYLDLFLSRFPDRRVPPLLEPRDTRHAHFFLGTHDHADHIDRAFWPALAKAAPSSRFVVPEALRPRLAKELKIPDRRFIGLDDLRCFTADEIRVTGIAAAHEFLDRDPDTGRYPYLGYVIEGNGCTIYHSGDCCVYEGLAARLRQWKLDAAILPINGRDAQRYARGCIGNMTYQEAADLAGTLAPKLTIPAHYDMIEGNQADPRLFTEYMRVKYPRLRTRVCEYGRRLIVG